MRAKSSPFVLSTSVAAILGFATLPFQAPAQSTGVFSNSGSLGTTDQSANVGLSTTKTYLQAIDLGDTTDTTVNGVVFTGSGTATTPSGTGWSITGTSFLYNGGGTLPDGTVGSLTNKFIYGGNPATMTLTGLTPGQTYVISLYNRSWEAAGQRVQNITASGASSATTVFDENIGASGQGQLNLLRYTFQASSATQTISILPQNAANTLHFYAFTNEQTFNNAWTSGADWSTAQWSVGQPNGVGANASFGAQTAPKTINLDAARTVGHLQFDGSNAWTLAGSNPLTLQTDVGGVSVLSALAGSHTISTPVVLGSNAVKFGSGSLTLAGSVSGTKSVTVNAGTLILGAANSYSGGTTVNSGATLRAGATGALGAPDAPLAVEGGGLVDMNGTQQSIGNLSGTGTVANNATGTNAVLTIGAGASNGTFAGVLADRTTGTGTGTLGLTKAGSGTVVLTGANSFSGPTLISDGKLQLNGSAAAGTLTTSGITIGATGTLGFTAGSTSTLAMKAGSTLTLNGGTIGFDLASSTSSDKITADNFVLAANSALSLTPISGLSIGSLYTLATYNTLSNSGNFTLSGTTAGRLSLIPVIGANAITVVPTLDSGTWNNASGGTWSGGPWTNYKPGVAGDSAVFGPALTANGTVTVDAPVSVGYLTLNNGTASYTLGAPGSSNITLDNGTFTALVDVKAGAHTIAENMALATGALVTTDSGTSLTIGGVISGAKSVSKAGAGTLILTNANTYSGGTTITEGTLQLGNGTANGSVARNITDNATLTFNNGSAQTFAGVISGSGAVTKLGSGALTLTGANTVTGGLTISSGTVDIGGNSTTGSVTGTIVNNSMLRFGRTNAFTITNVVNGTGSTIVSGGTSAATATTLGPGASINTPTLTIGDEGTTQGWLTFGAPNQMNGTTGVVLNITAITANSRINLNGFDQTVAGLTGTGIVQNNEFGTPAPAIFTINVPGSNSYSWTGLIRNQAGGALSLTKTGAGEQVMNFSITNPAYSGATTVNEGRLVFGSTFAAPAWSTSGIDVAAGAEVGLTGAGAGVISWSEGVVISGAGNLVRTGVDTNTVTITNTTNSFTGYTKLSGTGTLAVSSLSNIGVNSPLGKGNATSAATNAASLVFDGGILRYTGAAVTSDRLFTITQNGGTIESAGSGAVNLNNGGALATSGTGTRTLILTGTNTGNNTLAGVLADGTGGATSLVKEQNGKWVLTGASTYTGPTTINAGRLQLEGNAASGTRATSNLVVNPGATFGFTAGTGSTLTFANTFTLGGGTTILDLGSAAGSDKIVANTLALTADSAISFNQIGKYEYGTTYTLATYNTLSNAGGFTISGLSAGRLSLTPALGPTALTLTPVLDNAVWNKSSGGTWSAGPWTNYTPNAVGDAALFGPALTANGAVTLDTPKTVAYLTFDNANASYTIGSPGGLNLTFANVDAASAQVVVNAGNHTIAEDALLMSDVGIFTPASTSLTISGSLLGWDKSVTKNGAGTLTLSGANDFGGVPGTGFNINEGKVILGSATALTAAGGLAVNGGILDLNGNDASAGMLSGSSGGTITDNATTPGTTTLTIDQIGTSAFGGILADGATRKIAVVKRGAGSLTLGGGNTFSGGLTIAGGSVTAASGLGPALSGNIKIGDGSGIAAWLISGAVSQQYGPNTVLTFENAGQDAKFELRGTNQTLAGIDSTTAQSLSIIQNDETTAAGYTVAPGAATLTLNTTTDHSFYGIIRNQTGGPLGIVKEGVGTQELINNPGIVGFTYTGDTTINGGKLVLNLSGTTAAAFASNIIVNGSGTLGLDGSWTLARPVSGSGSVLKQGDGTVTLSGALSHTGNTTIAAGALILTGSLSATPKIEIQNGAVLDVSGVVGGFKLGAAQTLKGEGLVFGPATINGRLEPGDDIGTLLMDALTFGTGSVFALDINTSSVSGLTGASDLVDVNGSFSLSTGIAPTLSLTDLGSNVALAAGTKFTFITYTGTWNGGLFQVGGNTIADEGIFAFGVNQYRLDYDAGGNSVALIAVPEPGTGLMAIAGCGALFGLRRRRKV